MNTTNNNSKNKASGRGAKISEQPEIKNISIKDKAVYIPFIGFAVIFLGFLSYFLVSNSVEKKPEQAKESGGWSFNLIKPIFAQVEEGLSAIKPLVPFKKTLISEIENLKGFEDDNIKLSGAQKKALESNGFFLAENNIIKDQSDWQAMDDFVDMYDAFDGSTNEYYRKPSNAIFITSDTALHLYHILVDRSFQRMEETKFQPMLSAMTKALFLDSVNKYNSAEDEGLKQSYKRLSAYYLIPLVVLDAGSKSSGTTLKPEDFKTFAEFLEASEKQAIAGSDKELVFSLDNKTYGDVEVSDEIYELAKAELELIQKAEGMTKSPLFTPLRQELINDYSQFKPRSHYTKNDVLKSYFIAMMWYGRMGFPVQSPDLTRDALIITGQINNLNVGDVKLSKMWSDMSAVIDFFVGEVDDLTAYQYSGLIAKVYGADNLTDKNFADSAKLDEFIQKAKEELPAPKIISEALAVYDDGGQRDELLASTKQFRFMGQRFTPDAYIINNLTQGIGAPDPETKQFLPTMPTALMPMHVIAPENEVVKKYLDEWINDPERIKEQEEIRKQKGGSDKIIAKVISRLKQEFSAYSAATWTQNIYWSWLNCFKSLLVKYGEGYPYFMQNDSWMNKNLVTALGSFTELKHDTLLYAKQSYAELGGGGENPPELPPVVKGYVEPDLVFWNRIIALAETTEKGLKDRNVFPEEFNNKYSAFIDSAKFFRQIAAQELQNQKISDDDFEKLRKISMSLKDIVRPIGNQELTQKEKRAGIIADIHTDAVNEQILYEATGKPYIIYVVVEDINGARLTRGAAYSQYEFADELKERLSDEDWQARVYGNEEELPKANNWALKTIK
jgi:hypothetical protein